MQKLYGPDGSPLGTSFADLEQLASELGKTIAQELLTRSLDRHSAGAMDPAFWAVHAVPPSSLSYPGGIRSSSIEGFDGGGVGCNGTAGGASNATRVAR